jgi:hypothetical protein
LGGGLNVLTHSDLYRLVALATDKEVAWLVPLVLDAASDAGIINVDDRVFHARRKAIRYAEHLAAGDDGAQA